MQVVETNPTAQPVTFWQKVRHFRLPEGQKLVWWLIDVERGWWRQALAFTAFLLSFRFLFNWSWSLALAMIVSMFLHECGHALMFGFAQIKFVILFLFPLGAVAAPINKQEDERSDQLHWNTLGWLLQAGPAVNVLLILVFLAVDSLVSRRLPTSDLGVTLGQFSRDMVYINGLLAAMNLMPLWTLDAGQLFKVIYNSLEEHEDRWLTVLMLIGAALLLVFIIGVPGLLNWTYILTNTIGRFGWIVFLIFFALGILNKQGRDDPLNAFSKQAMNNRHVAAQLAVYTLLVGITLWVFSGPLL